MGKIRLKSKLPYALLYPYQRAKCRYEVISHCSRMKKRFRPVIANITLSVITIFALTWGVRYSWPDNIHVRYGFPLTWGIHILVTIQGPVDVWRVSLVALVVDLVFWIGILVLFQVIFNFVIKERQA